MNDRSTALDQAADADLIAASRARDMRAFEELVRRHKRGLTAFALSLVADLATAREVAHDAFCASYFALDGLRDESQFTAWLYTITRNFALANRRERERHRRRFRPLEAASDDGDALASRALESDQPTPEAHHCREERNRELAACISGLPDPLRHVISARYFNGESCAEIAAHLGTPVGTVTKRLTRARRVLRERLDATFGAEGGAS